MDDGYRLEWLEPGSAGQLARTSELLRLVFPRARHLTARYLEWQYALNPDGSAVAGNAFAGGELAGHLAGVAMTARLDGEQRRGLLFVNSAVHPGHRRRGLQSRLSEAIFEAAIAAGYSFCISTGNRYSTTPLLTRFRMLRPLEARLGLGTPVREAQAPPPAFERQWSDEAMRWRLANPEARYAVRTNGGDSTILSRTGVPGIAAILASGPNRWGLSDSGQAGPGRIWLGLDPAIRWERSRFLPVPMRLRPSPLNLLFRDLTGQSYLPDPDRVLFGALDFDAY